MRLGIGTRVLSRGLECKHLDGIGVYTSQLLKNFETLKLDVVKVDFAHARLPFEVHAGIGAIAGLPFLEMGEIEREIDVFHASDHHIPKLKKTPVVATIMDIIPLIHPQWVSKRLRVLKNFAFKKSIGWAEHLITISEYSKQDLVEHLAIDPSRISVIPLGVNEQFFHRSSPQESLEVHSKYELDRPYFLYVGTIQPRKNLHRILDAYLQLPLSIQDNVSLVIVGKYGWGEDALLHRLNLLILSSKIVWLQHVTDRELITLMQGSLGLVYPSLYEGFGLPVLEGFAAGVPVISSNTTSIPEVASDAALLVDPTHTDEISDAMRRIVEDEGLRQSLIKKGNEKVKNYSWDKSASEHLDVFHQIL